MRLHIKNATNATVEELKARADRIARDNDCRTCNWELCHIYFLVRGYPVETEGAYRSEYNAQIVKLGKEFPELVVADDEKRK